MGSASSGPVVTAKKKENVLHTQNYLYYTFMSISLSFLFLASLDFLRIFMIVVAGYIGRHEFHRLRYRIY